MEMQRILIRITHYFGFFPGSIRGAGAGTFFSAFFFFFSFFLGFLSPIRNASSLTAINLLNYSTNNL